MVPWLARRPTSLQPQTLSSFHFNRPARCRGLRPNDTCDRRIISVICFACRAIGIPAIISRYCHPINSNAISSAPPPPCAREADVCDGQEADDCDGRALITPSTNPSTRRRVRSLYFSHPLEFCHRQLGKRRLLLTLLSHQQPSILVLAVEIVVVALLVLLHQNGLTVGGYVRSSWAL